MLTTALGVLGPMGIDAVYVSGEFMDTEARFSRRFKQDTLFFLLVENIFKAQDWREGDRGAMASSDRCKATPQIRMKRTGMDSFTRICKLMYNVLAMEHL